MITNKLLNRAIEIIAYYCMKHDCNECRLLTKDGCIRTTVPCDWVEVLEEANNEAE